jgi:hypothetical protein
LRLYTRGLFVLWGLDMHVRPGLLDAKNNMAVPTGRPLEMTARGRQHH